MTAQNILIVIIGILIFDYLLSRIMDYLNDKNWSTVVPEEFRGIYDEEKYRKSQEYDKANSKFSLITDSFSFIVMLAMFLLGGFGHLDDYLRTELTTHPVWLALSFFGILYFINDIISLPFSIYQTFVIEEKFGFNRTTIKTFTTDKLKGYLLAIILGGGILSLFILFYQWVGKDFWIYAWIFACALLIFMQMFYTSLILPLFNKLTPLEEGDLRSKIEEYANKVKFPLVNIYVMDGSKRSSKANAFFSGMGSRKKIVLFDTLVQEHSDEELVSVLAHEVGHYKKKHTLQSIILSVLQTGLTLYLLSWFINNPELSFALGAKDHGFHLNLLAFGLLYSPISLIIGIFMNILSRKNEYEADHYAATTYNALHLMLALKKLSVNTLSNLNPHPLYVFFHYSHPPVLKRLKALKRLN